MWKSSDDYVMALEISDRLTVTFELIGHTYGCILNPHSENKVSFLTQLECPQKLAKISGRE